MSVFAQRSATFLLVSGGLAILFGIVATVWPIGTALTLVIVWGCYALVDGIAALVAAFRPEGRRSRVLLLLSGIVGVLAGLIAVFRPISSALALAWVLGIWLVVRGVIEIVAALGHDHPRPRWLMILGGVLWIIAGILFVANPGAGALTISLWLGILAIVWGVLLVGAGLAVRSRGPADQTVA